MKNGKVTLGFRMHKIWQILKYFSRQLISSHLTNFWRVVCQRPNLFNVNIVSKNGNLCLVWHFEDFEKGSEWAVCFPFVVIDSLWGDDYRNGSGFFNPIIKIATGWTPLPSASLALKRSASIKKIKFTYFQGLNWDCKNTFETYDLGSDKYVVNF